MKLESGWCLKLGLLVFGCFFTLLGSVLVRHAEVFVQRHARRHRIAGLCYLAWLVAGFVDLVSPISINRAMYHLVLGVLGVTVTLTAAFDFRFHDRVRNVASGTLEKHATVTFSEMIEHSFYQGLNLAQILCCMLLGCYFNFLPTNGFSIKPLKVKLFAKQNATEDFDVSCARATTVDLVAALGDACFGHCALALPLPLSGQQLFQEL